ncbi:MAG TPA: sugar phosphate nucleotidyltransferase [Vicinamibacterales bacterium]|nr:sugar phosphate nucleotidyltransferase [Vicinamibacterales bacterium]
MKAMVLAGGFGTRLRPFTFSIPKPLLPVGEKPILQIIIEQLRGAGVDEVVLATGYHAELIRTFCGDGSKFGIRATYVHEAKPLGTAGPLALARRLFSPDETFLLMNGDIITKLDFAEFLGAGAANGSDLTVGYTRHVYRSPFGVLNLDGGSVTGITEKPSHEYAISAGIYCVRSSCLDFVPDDTFFTMPDLMNALLGAGRKVGAYFIQDCWIGIESVEHFDEALRELSRLPQEAVPVTGR